MDSPLVSIIMPVYNAEKYIAESIESVINQTYENWELIIVNDGSTDLTLKIAKTFENRQIKVLSRKNEGQSAQLNFGISLALGEYIAIAHADDINLPTRIEKQVSFLQLHADIGICGTFTVFFNDYYSELKKYPTSCDDCFIALFYGNPLVHPSVMMRKTVIQKLNYIYAENLKAAEDYDLWIRLSELTKFGNVDEVLVKYRQHSSQLSKVRELEEQIIVKNSRILLIKQIARQLKKRQQTLIYYSLYRYNKMSFYNFLKGAKLLQDSLHEYVYSPKVIQRFLKENIISYLKSISFGKRLTYIPFCLYLFYYFSFENAINIFKRSFLSRSN